MPGKLTKRFIIILIIFSFVSLPSLNSDTNKKVTGKLSLTVSEMKLKIRYMNLLLTKIKGLRDSSLKIRNQAISLCNTIRDKVDNCSKLDPKEDIPVISRKMRRMGFRVGKIGVYSTKYYSAMVTSLHPGSSLEVKPGKRFPFSLVVRLLRGELDFLDMVWNRYMKTPEWMRQRGDTVSSDILPACSSPGYRGIFYTPMRIIECKTFIKTVENAKSKASYLYNYHKNVLKRLRSTREWVESRCDQGVEIRENDKRSIKNCMNSNETNIKNAFKKFAEYINIVEDMIKRYEKCKKNELLKVSN
ncbi:MAG: hypothetical protein ABFR75_10315 [Acidobacteriota bacterium]